MSIETIDRTAAAPDTDAGRILESVRALTPLIVARSDEIERARRIPPDLVTQLREAGCFRALVPRRLGGAQVDLMDHMRVIRELARADGSVGWTVMIGSSGPVILGTLPPATFDGLYASGPDMVGAGTFNPTGVATPVEGGYRATGRWAFASGCQHADWFIAHCILDDGRMPPLRMMVLAADDVEIVDTWSVSGLCGTGSHDFTLDGVFVPEERTFAVFDEGGVEGPLGRIPELLYSSLAIADVALGIAEGALSEITTLASAKVPMFADAPLAGNPLFRYRLGEASAHLRAAEALLDADIAATWATAVAGDEFTAEGRARARSTASWVVSAAAAVVDTAYTAGGGSAIYTSSPLQRRLRDVHAITQHFAVKPDTLTLAGSVLAGQDVDLTFL
ncbi:MAG TPA: acyl-CoA dehydrogenase family protein [Acidimicrobiales bacterium]|nr:acyl-CoA dehydrogenase family protein [Acidimicrobiales bacterium]